LLLIANAAISLDPLLAAYKKEPEGSMAMATGPLPDTNVAPEMAVSCPVVEFT
jgi:hypothetical protein